MRGGGGGSGTPKDWEALKDHDGATRELRTIHQLGDEVGVEEGRVCRGGNGLSDHLDVDVPTMATFGTERRGHTHWSVGRSGKQQAHSGYVPSAESGALASSVQASIMHNLFFDYLIVFLGG